MVVDGVTPFVVHNARWLSTFWLLGYTIGFFSAHPVQFIEKSEEPVIKSDERLFF